MNVSIDPRLEEALIKEERAASMEEVIVRLINERARELGLLDALPLATLELDDGDLFHKALFETPAEEFRRFTKLGSPGR